MQTDLENQDAQNHRLRTKVQVLERRLSEQSASASSEEQPTNMEASDARIERLEQEVFELRDQRSALRSSDRA